MTTGRPTYANVVSTLALFVALGGTTYAATSLPRNSVGARQIATGAVRSSEVLDGSLLSRDFRPGQLPAGPKGDDGRQGVTGPTGATGATGASGPRGPADALSAAAGSVPGIGNDPVIAVSLPTPVGRYAVVARVTLTGASKTTVLADCYLGVGGSVDFGEDALDSPNDPTAHHYIGTVTMTAVGTVSPKDTSINVKCRTANSGTTISVQSSSLTAIRLGG